MHCNAIAETAAFEAHGRAENRFVQALLLTVVTHTKGTLPTKLPRGATSIPVIENHLKTTIRLIWKSPADTLREDCTRVAKPDL